jgi:hypothetical protein
MLDVVFVMGFLVEQRLQPARGIESWLNVLVLACKPDMLHDSGVVSNPPDDGIDCGIRLG